MNHPEALLVPLMMLADYFLTVLSAVWLEKGYANHFRAEHFELNPVWQKDIAAKRWFNPRHLALVVFASALLIGLGEWLPEDDIVMEATLGAVIVCFGFIIARHVTNLLTFRYVSHHPNEISGQVTMSHRIVLGMSLRHIGAALIPIALIAVFSPTPFAVGGCLGVLLVAVVHLFWIRKSRKAKTAAAKTENQPPEQSSC